MSEKFYFNKRYAIPLHISDISPNGIVYFTNGRKAIWKVKDVKNIINELPSLKKFNSEIFQRIINKFHVKFSDEVIGRIIYNLYYENLADKLGID